MSTNCLPSVGTVSRSRGSSFFIFVFIFILLFSLVFIFVFFVFSFFLLLHLSHLFSRFPIRSILVFPPLQPGGVLGSRR